jgi:hypothetical protein
MTGNSCKCIYYLCHAVLKCKIFVDLLFLPWAADVVCVVSPDLETTETKDINDELNKIKEFVTFEGEIVFDIGFWLKCE